MTLPRLTIATLATVCFAPAQAAGTVTLQGSTTTLSVEAVAGTGIADANLPCDGLPSPDEVEDCGHDGTLSLTATRSNAGRTDIAGSGWAYAEDSLWTAHLTFTWSTGQAFSLSAEGGDTVLAASGRHLSELVPTVGGPGAFPSRLTTVRNFQSIGFTLDAPTAYTMSGLVFGEYLPIQLYGTDAQGNSQLVGTWCSLQGVACEGSGTLAAGTYMARVFEWANSGDTEVYGFGWDYRFTFHDSVPAVPEPGSLAMMALGLGAIRAWRRGRAGTA